MNNQDLVSIVEQDETVEKKNTEIIETDTNSEEDSKKQEALDREKEKEVLEEKRIEAAEENEKQVLADFAPNKQSPQQKSKRKKPKYHAVLEEDDFDRKGLSPLEIAELDDDLRTDD